MNPIYIVLIVIAVIILWVIYVYNKLNKLVVKIDESLSGIDVALTKRYDVLTKMIEVVKGYAKHEKETLVEVVKLRDNMSLQEKSEANKAMDEAYNKINVIAENYPELKASENYNALQLSISDVEEHLQAARRLYNSNVSIYNQQIVIFPNSLLAGMFSMKKRDFFEAENTKKEDVKIEL